jgi:integrase
MKTSIWKTDMTDTNDPSKDAACKPLRSLPIQEWPDADKRGWENACRPGARLKPGGSASHLGEVSREDFARRYGAFLGFLDRAGRLDRNLDAAAQVILSNVEPYITELNGRVRSVTVYNCIYKLRRTAELLAPAVDYSWLAEIEKDLALVMVPRSKVDRLVFIERLVDAGLTLIAEAKEFAKSDLSRARGVRNGLMVALLAFDPIRLKNYAALRIGHTFKEVHDNWWIALPARDTKSHRPDERRVPKLLNSSTEFYLSQSRPVLFGSRPPNDFLWISSTTGKPLTKKNLGTLISKITLSALGVDVSPHLFRTAAATTAATYGSSTPNLASAVLGHTDPRVTEEHYNRATTVNAAGIYEALVRQYQNSEALENEAEVAIK